MKYCWRITKYNPIFRDERGSYVKDEWTSISDIGKEYCGKTFTIEQYLKTEDKYINAILKLMRSAKIPYLQVKNLCKWEHKFESEFPELYTDRMLNVYNSVKNDDMCKEDELRDLCKLELREKIGFQLWYKSRMYVHFGYDYYMYIGIDRKCNDALDWIASSGLFAEQYESPYLNYDDSDDD